MSYRIAIDIGGTFTDYVAMDEKTSELFVTKSSSTPDNFSKGVLDTIEKSGIPLEECKYFVHGSTIVINALTERKGAKTALITTKGFRDVLEITRANRTDIFNLYYAKPEVYVPRKYRFEVDERQNKDGDIIKALNEKEVKEIAKICREEGIEAIAVCLLYSYVNSDNEKKIKEILKEEMPEVEISISSEVVNEFREYERTNTTVFNSYVKPITSVYLNSLKHSMEDKGLHINPYAMQSNGGTASFDMIKSIPINILESGPVGGIIGANELGKMLGEKNIITFDIGGTTAKTSLIYNNEVKISTDYKFAKSDTSSGFPIKAPIVDIIEIGAGGGSIAWVDSVGNLKIGPQSAGSDPGPACYGKGGLEPTLTDANMIAGRIDPDKFLGGGFDINIDNSHKAISKIADFYKITNEEAAMGIISIANNNMMHALKLVSVRKGYDPREFIMVAMGGNGAIHSPQLGRELNVKKIVIPRNSAVFSAWGMLMTDSRQDFIQTKIMKIETGTLESANRVYEKIIKEAKEFYNKYGFSENELTIIKTADIRYEGQEHTVRTPLPSNNIEDQDIEIIRQNFEKLHEQYYAFTLPDTRLEFVNMNVTVFGRVEKSESKPLEIIGKPEEAIRTKRVVDYEEFGRLEVPVYMRERLGTGSMIIGPAIIEEKTTSTLVYPDQKLSVDKFGNLIIERGGTENE